MKKITVNNGRNDVVFNIPTIEEKYKAKFVGQLALKIGGMWSADDPAEVYYQETPPVEGYSKYFALMMRNGAGYIMDGSSAVEGVINGVEANDGEIIYSRARHDYRTSADGSASIDGGRDYMKRAGGGRTICMKIVDGEWYELEEEDFIVMKLKGE